MLRRDIKRSELAIITLALFASLLFGGFQRIAERISTKVQNNAMLVRNDTNLAAVETFLRQTYPCAGAVMLDVFVPDARATKVPARLYGVWRARHERSEIDAIVVNGETSQNGRSEILFGTLGDYSKEFVTVRRFGELELMMRRSIACPT